MKQVIQLYKRLQHAHFEDRYPDYDLEDGKVHILYIGTYLNGTGYYRHIVPAYELNQTDTHTALLSSLHKWDYNKQFGDSGENPIIPDLIAWADYVILPPLFDDARYFFQAIREHQPDIKIVLDIDQNFHSIPKEHPAHGSFTNKQMQFLLKNMAAADQVNLVSEGLFYYYEKLCHKYHPDSEATLNYLPNYLSALAYENVQPIQHSEHGKIRIGLVGGNHLSYDFQQVTPILRELKKIHGKHIEIIFLGWDGKHKGTDLTSGLDVVFEKSVRFTQYFDKLNSLALDLVLLPVSNTYYNTHGRSPIKYLELSASGIPVVASDLPPYNLLIEHEETGLLAEDKESWMLQTNRLIQDSELRLSIGENALKSAWYNSAYNWESVDYLTQLYT